MWVRAQVPNLSAAPIRCGGIVSGPSDSRRGWVRGGGSGQWVGFAGPRLGVVPQWCLLGVLLREW